MRVLYTKLVFEASGSSATTVWLLVKPISPLAISGVMIREMFKAPPKRGLTDGIGGVMFSNCTLFN